MDKKNALRILIDGSSLFSPQLKSKLLAGIDSMPDVDVQDLGVLLARERKDSLAFLDWNIARLDEILNKIKTMKPAPAI